MWRFRARWGEPFLEPEAGVPRTWLNRGLNEKLYRRFERWSLPGRELGLGVRLQGRWLDFLITDGMGDGFRLLALFGRTAAMQVAEMEAWRTTKRIRFAAECTLPLRGARPGQAEPPSPP